MPRRSAVLIGLFVACHVVIATLQADDRVVFAPPDTSGEIIIRGEIVDLAGSSLRVRAEGSEEARVIPLNQIIRIETPYHPDYEAGLARLNEGQSREAEELFLAAYDNDPRGWVRREILARLVQCAERREDHVTAATRFFDIIRTDPQSRFWGQAPVPWIPQVVDDALRAEAVVWLGRTTDVDRFLGASWLLFDQTHHAAAAATLREFSRGANTRLSALAIAQQWRIRLREDNPSDVELAGWRDHIEFIPAEFRSGPQALLAAGYQRASQFDQAAAEWLWISTVYTEQDALTARATLEAAECLHRLGRTGEATRLFREMTERFAWSPQAGIALQRLTEIEAAATESSRSRSE